MERLPTVLIPGVDAGPVLQQQLGRLHVTVGRRDVQLPGTRMWSGTAQPAAVPSPPSPPMHPPGLRPSYQRGAVSPRRVQVSSRFYQLPDLLHHAALGGGASLLDLLLGDTCRWEKSEGGRTPGPVHRPARFLPSPQSRPRFAGTAPARRSSPCSAMAVSMQSRVTSSSHRS